MHLLSLRNKILSCGLLILILVTGFNLYYTYHVFEDDKKSYIFENVLRSTEFIDRELSRSDIKDVKSIMDSDKIFSYILINNNSVIYGDKNLYQKTLLEKASNQSIVTEETISNRNFLIGLIKNQETGYITIAYIDKDKAFASLHYLIKKNLYFSIIVFGIVMIITVFFSKSITMPIIQIIKKTAEISEGDYDNQVIVKSNDELKVLGDSINNMSHEIKTLLDEKLDMISQLEDANKKLDIYSKDLERLVDERTKDLKDANTYITAILESLSQGLFVIRPDGKCSDLYTKSCLSIFGSEPKDKHFSSLIDKKNHSSIDKWIEITFSQKMPFSSCTPLGPSHFELGHLGDKNFKHIKLEYYPLVLDDELSGIVVSATDITQELILKEDINNKEAYIHKVMQFVLNKDEIKNLTAEANSLINEIIEAQDYIGFTDRALMIFHTINGGFAMYSFLDIQKYAIECEDYIQLNRDKDNINKEIKARARFARDLINQSINELETKFANNNLTSFSKEDISYLENELLAKGEEGKVILQNFLEKKSVSSLFAPYPKLVKKISKDLNKPMKELVIPESSYRVEPQKIQELSNALVHIFKNSLDHGIEVSSQRIKAGKEEQGEIKLDINTQEDIVHIKISDDGAGLDLKAIRSKLERTYSKNDLDKLTKEELMAKIFDPNISTRETVSQYSGRGIGMSAVKEAVDKLHGNINVYSNENQGTTFHISFKV